MKKVKPKKYLGQHFLKDENISKKIIELLDNKQKFFLEISAGYSLRSVRLYKNVLRDLN